MLPAALLLGLWVWAYLPFSSEGPARDRLRTERVEHLWGWFGNEGCLVIPLALAFVTVLLFWGLSEARMALRNIGLLLRGIDSRSTRCQHMVAGADARPELCATCGREVRRAEAGKAAILARKQAEERRLAEQRELETRRQHEALVQREGVLGAIKALSPVAFEHFVAELFRREGYEARVTKASGDSGIDINLRRGESREVVQCKKWEGQVGEPVLRDLLGASVAAGASRAVLVTTGSLTASAEKWRRGQPIRVIDGQELAEIVQERFPGDDFRTTLTRLPRNS